MKKYIYILCSVLMGVFASCSKSEMGGETPQSNQVTLKVTADEGLQTRGTTTNADRYAIEVYSDNTYTTVANVFTGGTNKSNNTTGVFTMTLDRSQEYHCLIWADKVGATVYDITSLKEVTLTGKAVEAWHGTTTIPAGTKATLDASLTRAVSKISLNETGILYTGTLKLNFDQPTKFNVVTQATSIISARPEELISITADVDGTTTRAKLNSTDVFVLSSVATADLTKLTFQYKEETAFEVPNVPLKANINTNINGHYTFSKDTDFNVTADEEWNGPENDVKFPVKVGDFYYQNKTWSSTYIPNVQNPCIGIVFWVDPMSGVNGKILSLDEQLAAWSTLDFVRTYSNSDNGQVNTNTVLALPSYTAETYPAFAWCVAKNTTAPTGVSWYLPAALELKDGISANKTTLDKALKSASATVTDKYGTSYWSSNDSDDEIDRNTAYCIIISYNTKETSLRGNRNRVRAVATF